MTTLADRARAVTRRCALALVATAALVACGSADGVEIVASGPGAEGRPSATVAIGELGEPLTEFDGGPVDPNGAQGTARAAGSEPATIDTLVEPDSPAPETVAVVGDSLTLSASEEIEVALTANGYEVAALEGLESRRMTHGGSAVPPGIDAIDEILDDRAPRPGLWVVALGTNDVGSGENLDGFRADIRQILDLIPADAPVVWVDLWIGGREEPIEAANRAIRTELRQWPAGSAVVDWYAHGNDDGIITADGVHLTQAGQQLFAASIVDTIEGLYTD